MLCLLLPVLVLQHLRWWWQSKVTAVNWIHQNLDLTIASWMGANDPKISPPTCISQVALHPRMQLNSRTLTCKNGEVWNGGRGPTELPWAWRELPFPPNSGWVHLSKIRINLMNLMIFACQMSWFPSSSISSWDPMAPASAAVAGPSGKK